MATDFSRVLEVETTVSIVSFENGILKSRVSSDIFAITHFERLNSSVENPSRPRCGAKHPPDTTELFVEQSIQDRRKTSFVAELSVAPIDWVQNPRFGAPENFGHRRPPGAVSAFAYVRIRRPQEFLASLLFFSPRNPVSRSSRLDLDDDGERRGSARRGGHDDAAAAALD